MSTERVQVAKVQGAEFEKLPSQRQFSIRSYFDDRQSREKAKYSFERVMEPREHFLFCDRNLIVSNKLKREEASDIQK